MADLWAPVHVMNPLLQFVKVALHLKVKPRRSIIVPLRPHPDTFLIKRRVGTMAHAWFAFSVELEAPYLGMLVGPNTFSATRWASPAAKFASRGQLLTARGLGWMTILRLFSMVMASILSHVGQLCTLPGTMKAELAAGILRLFWLPHNRLPAWLFARLSH